ncbi:copia protein [Tanacetum coccineum]
MIIVEDVSNVPVWLKLHGVSVVVFSEDGFSVIATKLDTSLMLNSYTSNMCIQSWGRSSYARALIEIQADVELKDTIVVAMSKLVGEGFYRCTIRVEYEWKPPKCTCCKIFGSNTNSTTPIVEKIDKVKRLIIDGKEAFVDDEGKPLEKVDYASDHDSDDEVEPVDNEITSFLASKMVGYGLRVGCWLECELLNGAWFLESKREWGWRGVKEKDNVVAAKDIVSLSVIDEPVVKKKQSSLVDRSIPNVEKQALNFLTLFTPGGNGVDVVVLLESIRAISESSMDGLNAMLENGPWFIRNHPLILKKWNPNVNLLKEAVGNIPGRSSYARAMIELRADVELKDTIVEECPKNPGLGVAKNLKKPSQAPRGVPVGSKVGFKLVKVYIPVSKKTTTSTSHNKQKVVELTKEVSNSNPFDVLNSVDNDVKFGTNGGTSNLASNGANSSVSSFWNVQISRTRTTLIVDKIEKLEKLIIDGKVTLVNDGKPLKKVDYPGDHDCEDEVESVDNDMTRSMASERVSFGTKSLLEQLRDTYENGDYDEDPYDDDMYEGQDFPDKIQDICDNLDIRVRGRRKK